LNGAVTDDVVAGVVETWHAASLQENPQNPNTRNIQNLNIIINTIKQKHIMSKQKFQNKYRISSARAWWHDYNGGLYFITICTAGMEHYFGKVTDGAMCLNPLGDKLNQIILDTQMHNPYAEIQLFQIMPNHLHLIICVNESTIDMDKNNTNAELNGSDTDDVVVDSRDVACRVCKQNTNAEFGDADTDDVVAGSRDVACRVSTGKSTKPGNDINAENPIPAVKNEKMQLIAEKCGLLSIAMGGLKSATTKFANDNKITFGWQERFHDHIIRNQEEYERIAVYIENNPMTWEKDKFYRKG